MIHYFSNYAELETYLEEKQTGFLVIGYQNIPEYEGMVLYKAIHFNVPNSVYQLALEWISFGLDFYGDTLQECYQYRFTTLRSLTDYLMAKYMLPISNIPITYSIDLSQFPNPLDHADQKPSFEIAWKKFEQDFKSGMFLDSSLTLIYSSLNRNH